MSRISLRLYPPAVEPARIDPYATLGVRRDATAAQVARAYHRLAKELHPDLRGDATAKRMRDVNAAWEILSNPAKRAAWDGGQDVVAEGVHWTPGTRRVNSASSLEYPEWSAELRPRRYAAYPPRPRPEERRRSDSPWLVGILGSLILVGLVIAAGLFGLGSQLTLADRFQGFQGQQAFPELNRVVAGTAIRITFGVGGFEGYDLLTDGAPTSRFYPCENGTTGLAEVQPAVVASRSSLSYAPASHAYTYTWKTDSSWEGACRELTFTFRDGSDRSALFDFRPVAGGSAA